MDSGIESPALPQCLNKCIAQLPSFAQLKAMVPKLNNGKVPKNNSAVDHTTKEKVRRLSRLVFKIIIIKLVYIFIALKIFFK